jgi:hypothetical protein
MHGHGSHELAMVIGALVLLIGGAYILLLAWSASPSGAPSQPRQHSPGERAVFGLAIAILVVLLSLLTADYGGRLVDGSSSQGVQHHGGH